jgi:hypothetical protein
MKNYFNLGFIVLVLVVLGCSCPKLNDLGKKDSSPSPTSTPYVTPTGTTANKTTSGTSADLTKEKADKIKTGISRSEVESILGPGEEVSTSKGGGLTFVVMKWSDSKYNYIIITFRNGKVYNFSNGITQ